MVEQIQETAFKFLRCHDIKENVWKLSDPKVQCHVEINTCQLTYGGFRKWWVSPATMGFPTKNDHFGVEIGGTTI